MKNYRPIALLNTVGKVFSSVLNERLCKWIERVGVLSEEQNDFRGERRTEDKISVVNEMAEMKHGKDSQDVMHCTYSSSRRTQAMW